MAIANRPTKTGSNLEADPYTIHNSSDNNVAVTPAQEVNMISMDKESKEEISGENANHFEETVVVKYQQSLETARSTLQKLLNLEMKPRTKFRIWTNEQNA
jgi:hypothetical protein